MILQYAHMLRYFCFTLLICLNLTSFAQSYIGFGADNFNGGGHDNASGGKSDLSLDATIAEFLSILPEYKNELTKS